MTTETKGEVGESFVHQRVTVHVTVTRMTPTDPTVELYQRLMSSAAGSGRCSHVSPDTGMRNDWRTGVREKGEPRIRMKAVIQVGSQESGWKP